jgi:hypothetical protein
MSAQALGEKEAIALMENIKKDISAIDKSFSK